MFNQVSFRAPRSFSAKVLFSWMIPSMSRCQKFFLIRCRMLSLLNSSWDSCQPTSPGCWGRSGWQHVWWISYSSQFNTNCKILDSSFPYKTSYSFTGTNNHFKVKNSSLFQQKHTEFMKKIYWVYKWISLKQYSNIDLPMSIYLQVLFPNMFLPFLTVISFFS